jgi:hypothetical protein
MERAPVVVEDARERERPVPTSERPFAGERIERAHCLLLKVFQSVLLRSPVDVREAYGRLNT